MSKEQLFDTPINTPTQNQFTNSELKQIEEMAKDIYEGGRNRCHHMSCYVCQFDASNDDLCREKAIATYLYEQNYRKQKEGEWVVTNNNGFWHYDCPFCDDGYAQETKLPISNYCANCGARLNEPKMKGGE